MKLDEHALQGSMAVIDNKDCCKLLQIEKLFPFLIDLIESFLSIKEILFCRLSCKPLCHLYHREYISQYQAVDKIIFPTRHEELSNSLQQKLQKRFKNSHFTTDFCHKALFIRYLDQQTGYGLFTKQYHRKGEELGVYLGEYISTKECLRRYSDHYDTLVSSFLFFLFLMMMPFET